VRLRADALVIVSNDRVCHLTEWYQHTSICISVLHLYGNTYVTLMVRTIEILPVPAGRHKNLRSQKPAGLQRKMLCFV
jgi:hypothetical protein